MSTRLYVRNMVCDRCRKAVTDLLARTGRSFTAVHLGEVELPKPPTAAQRAALKDGLRELGFELIDDRLRPLSSHSHTFV